MCAYDFGSVIMVKGVHFIKLMYLLVQSVFLWPSQLSMRVGRRNIQVVTR